MAYFGRIVRSKRAKPSSPAAQVGRPIVVTLSYRTRLERLWHTARSLCHWCATPTRLIGMPGKLPKDAATVDHIYSRLNPRHRGKRGWVVLACNACNMQRAHDEVVILKGNEERMRQREKVQRLIAQSCAA